MSINEIKKIIKEQVEKRGFFYEERKSVSTGSWYFKIFNNDISLLFRVSDHKTTKGVITLRLDHKINRDIVTRFINNRCDDLSYRRVKSLLGV